MSETGKKVVARYRPSNKVFVCVDGIWVPAKPSDKKRHFTQEPQSNYNYIKKPKAK